MRVQSKCLYPHIVGRLVAFNNYVMAQPANMLQFYVSETREALEVMLASGSDRLRIMDLQGIDARSLLDLLDEVCIDITTRVLRSLIDF
jgi:hypothetical protein